MSLLRHRIHKGFLYTQAIADLCHKNPRLTLLLDIIAERQKQNAFSVRPFQKWRYVAHDTTNQIVVTGEDLKEAFWTTHWVSNDVQEKTEAIWWIDNGVLLLPKEYKP